MHKATSGNAIGLDHKIEFAPGLRDAGKTDSRHAATPIISVFGHGRRALRWRPRKSERVLGDHQLLIGGQHIDREAAGGGRDHLGVGAIRFLVQRRSEPGEPGADPGPDGCGILADARGEDEGVEPAKRGRQRACEEPDAVDEVVDREAGPRIAACLELAHVIANARQALQAAVAIKEILDRGGAHALLGKHVENDAGIELPAAGAHGQAIESG